MCVLIPMNMMTMMNCVVNVIAHANCKQCHKHDCMIDRWMDGLMCIYNYWIDGLMNRWMNGFIVTNC